MSALWLLPLAIGLPLVLAALSALPLVRERSLTLAIAAPLPGLAAALFAPRGEAIVIPDLVLGVTLTLSDAGALFLGGASLLWLIAGLYSRLHMKGKDGAGNFALFWNLCLAGNMGVFLAADAVTFYVAFALVSLMAFPLVIHDRSEKALHAGVVYIVLAVLGEAALLGGLILASGAAGGSTEMGALTDAIWLSADRPVILALLITGFGIKAGLVPLHIWLPVAHPAAPVPASAVLSGAIVKAGVFGLLVFLPLGSELSVSGGILTALGFTGAFGAALYGLTQRDPKAVLAYSTVSQMGLVLAAIGAGLAASLPLEALMAGIAIYALHHGLAKGALFLGVGAMNTVSGGAARRLRLALGLIALSVAGLPLTGGALAKLALKAPMDPLHEWLITVSALTTALLLTRFLHLLQPRAESHEPSPPLRSILVMMLGLAAITLPWLVFSQSGLATGYAWQAGNLMNDAWPLALAGLAALAWRRTRLTLPAAPQGDLLVIPEAAARAIAAAARSVTRKTASTRDPGTPNAPVWRERLSALIDRTEATLDRTLALSLLLIALAGVALLLG
jgi:hydrogenase-4 component B